MLLPAYICQTYGGVSRFTNAQHPSPTSRKSSLAFLPLFAVVSCSTCTHRGHHTAHHPSMTVVVSSSSSLCVAVALHTRPALHVPHHALRRPASAFEAASRGEACASFGDSTAVTSVQLVSATEIAVPPVSPSRSASSPSPPGLLIANSLRGGCATGRTGVRYRRARRPLRRFFAPALVW